MNIKEALSSVAVFCIGVLIGLGSGYFAAGGCNKVVRTEVSSDTTHKTAIETVKNDHKVVDVPAVQMKRIIPKKEDLVAENHEVEVDSAYLELPYVDSLGIAKRVDTLSIVHLGSPFRYFSIVDYRPQPCVSIHDTIAIHTDSLVVVDQGNFLNDLKNVGIGLGIGVAVGLTIHELIERK